MLNRIHLLPSFVREPYARFMADWTAYRTGTGELPPKQKQIAVPDVPNLSVLIEHTGSLSWRSRFRDPLSGNRTCMIHAQLDKMSLAQAIAQHADLEASIAEGHSPIGANLTVSEAFSSRVVPHSQRKRKKTLKEDISKFEREFAGSIGGLKLRQIKPALLRQEAERIRAKKKPATAERYVAFLMGLFRDFTELGLLAKDPASTLKIRSVRPSKKKVIASPEQLARIGAVIGSSPSQQNDFFLGLMLTGARESELRLARFSDIDESSWTLRLHDAKSGHDEDIVLPEAFRPLYARRKAARRNDYLFPALKGDGPMSYQAKAFKRLMEQAGVTGLTPHSFRKGFSTAGVQSEGVSVHDVSSLLRHSSTRVTETHYLVAVESRLKSAADKASQRICQQLGLDTFLRPVLRPTMPSIVITQRHVLVIGGGFRSTHERKEVRIA